MESNNFAEFCNQNETMRNSFEEILHYGLMFGPDSIFESLRSNTEFYEADPKGELEAALRKINKPIPPSDPEPKLEQYTPKMADIEKAIPYVRNDMIREANEKFHYEHAKWLKRNEQFDIETEAYNKLVKEIQSLIPAKHSEWLARKEAFFLQQKNANQALDTIKRKYSDGTPESIIQYLTTILAATKYPDGVESSFSIEYSTSNNTVIIDASLPNSNQTPQSATIYLTSGKLKLKELSAANKRKAYEATVYQMIFRILYTVFAADFKHFVEAIVLNGWVCAINRSTGKQNTSCIASIHVTRRDFEHLDLKNIDPKACFKSLRGICASDLTTVTAIAPIITSSKSDRRFIESRDIIHSVDSGTNLASMGWEDFEHLIRDIFESEFKCNGGEVKVTQASRDGGVDAIAFDPDPIRGGKIVIQAKRYTNTVSVSAVRDLYGTILNEGATKGILVTTSDYGPDSFEFAKGKPITLLNGSNLLFLLEKHGHKARIDLQEAKLSAKDDK